MLGPCAQCNDFHAGVSVTATGHAQDVREGVGYVRLIAVGRPDGSTEFCFRCSCMKSGWVNVPNEVLDRCVDRECVCHTKERCQ